MSKTKSLPADFLRTKSIRSVTAIYLFSFFLICEVLPYQGRGRLLLTSVLSLFLTEVLVRALLISSYGKYFKNVLFSYVLVDDGKYGYALKKNTNLKSVDEPIHDAFVFPMGTPRVFDLEKNKSNRVDLNVNSLGFRGPEFKKSSSKFRIFCSGGSTTACDRNADAETWPSRLEEHLKQAGYDVEVINAGCFGWYSEQEFLRLKNEIVNYSPDLVLFHQGWNEEFEYSSQSLGRGWKPRAVRNTVEANNLYTSHCSVLSQRKLLSLYLPLQSFMKARFARLASFHNPERWRMLKNADYVKSWIETLADAQEIAAAKGFGLFLVNYPCLSRITDPASDRRLYYANTRLTPQFADYQALSKARITAVIRHVSSGVSTLDVEKDFIPYRGESRLELFHDEIHLTGKGNDLFAQFLSNQLAGSKEFNALYRREAKTNTGQTSLKKLAVNFKNPEFIDRYIETKYLELKFNTRSELNKVFEIPPDRYTTF